MSKNKKNTKENKIQLPPSENFFGAQGVNSLYAKKNKFTGLPWRFLSSSSSFSFQVERML